MVLMGEKKKKGDIYPAVYEPPCQESAAVLSPENTATPTTPDKLY